MMTGTVVRVSMLAAWLHGQDHAILRRSLADMGGNLIVL